MHTLPPAMILLLRPFAPLFSKRVWMHVQILLVGVLLAPAQRTVTAALRVVGLGQTPHFQRYHRVLSRASWSSLAASRVLLCLLVAAFVPTGPLVVGIDETVERRTGAKIDAKGVYRDAVRSSHSHFVKATGLRWVSLMLLAPIPWANRAWALPFLTALAPSERYDAQHGRRHKALTDWAWQLLRVDAEEREERGQQRARPSFVRPGMQPLHPPRRQLALHRLHPPTVPLQCERLHQRARRHVSPSPWHDPVSRSSHDPRRIFPAIVSLARVDPYPTW